MTIVNCYGRFGFSIAQPDGGHGPFTFTITTGMDDETVCHTSLCLTERQGLLLLAELAEFSARVVNQALQRMA